jgi:hypothetical protein
MRRRGATTPETTTIRSKPVRVKLKPTSSITARPYPPEGMSPEWWERLMAALGTCSSDFVLASLHQLVRAARLPGSGTSEVGVNAALAFIEGARPRDEVEAALVIQMACIHSATMCVLSRFAGDYGGERSMTAGANAIARLARAFAAQVEALRRLLNGGSQLIRIEHVHIHEGAQAVIGRVVKNENREAQEAEKIGAAPSG